MRIKTESEHIIFYIDGLDTRHAETLLMFESVLLLMHNITDKRLYVAENDDSIHRPVVYAPRGGVDRTPQYQYCDLIERGYYPLMAPFGVRFADEQEYMDLYLEGRLN